jgi:Domain of unknown function (DUF222)/HNH endonuclease
VGANARIERSDEELIERMDIVHSNISAGQRELFRLILEADACKSWEQHGARDLAHWLCIRYGISEWKARRWIAAAHALEALPRLSSAFETGELGIDKVVELARFATEETEEDLVVWASRVSGSWIRRKADLAERQSIEETKEALRQRSIAWYFAGPRFHLELDTSSADGVRIVTRLRATAETIPVMPGEEGPRGASARDADAAVLLLTSGGDGAAGRSTVLIHARLDDLIGGDGACEMDGEAIHPETARRAICHSRFQVLLEDERGEPLELGRLRRDPSPAMVRLLRLRDTGCTFPGCGSKRFAEAHHIEWWSTGGRTDLENLALICSFHHKLVHEYGWRIRREDGEIRWFHPDGRRYRAGPAPPATAASTRMNDQMAVAS